MRGPPASQRGLARGTLVNRSVPLVAAAAVGVALVGWWLLPEPPATPAPPSTPPVSPAPKPEPASAPAAAPDVVILLWDTVRADRLSLYGHSRPTSPTLARLAARGQVYTRAVSAGMWTVPAHASMFTGLPVLSHGARVGWLWLDHHHTTLAEHFREHGYRTWAWSANPYLSPSTNLLQGFDDVRLTWQGDDAVPCAQATRGKLIERDRSMEIAPSFPATSEGWAEHLTVAKDCAPLGVDALLKALDESDAPLFAYVNLLEAHHPRLPSLAARQAVLDAETVERGLQTDGSLKRLMGAMEGKASFTDAEHQDLLGVYDASLRDLDDALAALVAGLDTRGALDDTVIVVVGDHGEHFGEAGMYDHRWSVHQALLHVPLVVVGPGVPPATIDAPVSTAGLYGTLPKLAGLPAPAVSYPVASLDDRGPVFAALVAPTPRLAEVERAWPDLDPHRWRRRYGVIIDGRLKLTRDDEGVDVLHDIVADPLQTRPLDPASAPGLGEALLAWRRGAPRFDPALRTPADRPGRPMEVDAETRAQLEALGYMGAE